MASNDLQKRGQELYRQKKYNEALECFNAAVARGGRDYITALDNRAATHTKLGNLQAALRDGRLMIQEERSSCSGYLRTGKVLQLLGKENIALGIYEYGIRSVPEDDPQSTLLQGMQNKLSRRRSQPTLVDPLQVLPLELAETVMKYLSFRQKVTLLRVSKSWRQYLESTPSFWSEMDFSEASKPVTISAVRSYVKRSKGTITQARLHRFTYQENDVLKFLTTRCKDLNSLIITHGFTGGSLLRAAPFASNLKTVVVSQNSQITLDTATQVIGHCNKLDRVEFLGICPGRFKAKWTGDMTNIRTLTLNAARGYQSPINQLVMNVLLEKIPNVRNLSLQGWGPSDFGENPDFSGLKQLQRLNLSWMAVNIFPTLPPSLESLIMSDCFSCRLGSTLSQSNLLNNSLTSLTSLSMSNVHHLDLNNLQKLLEPNRGNLEELDVKGCLLLDAAPLLFLGELGYLKKIASLEVGCGDDIDDRCIESLIKHTPRLRKLTLAYTRVTGVGIKAIALKPQDKLEHLVLQHCLNISPDALDYVRAKGVKVDFLNEDTSRKSRKVQSD